VGVVSHDRHLLRTTVDEFWVVEGGKVARFEGDLEDYRTRVQSPSQSGEIADKSQRKEARESERADRQAWLAKRRVLSREIAAIETRLAKLSDEKSALEAELASADFYTAQPPAKVAASLKRQAELQAAVDAAEMEWLTLQADLEALGDDPLNRR